jgi:DNA replication protein DnaC
MRPMRQPGESGESWIRRMTDYWETDAGKTEAAKEAEFFAAQRAREEAAKARLVAAQKSAAIKALCIPDRVLEIIQAEAPLRITEALDAVRMVQGIAVLSGNPGCGKTVAACSWLYAGGFGLFVKSSRLARWDRYDDSEMRRLLGASRLVLDDLGTEYQDTKGNFDSILDEVIDVRYDKRLSTVITTNLDAAAFKARYGERIADRIRECGKFVSLATKSMRGAA